MGRRVGLENRRQDLRNLLGWGAGDHDKISFKCSDLAYELLKERPGLIPAPYLGRAKWIQVAEPGAMSDEDIEAAYQIVSRKLTKAARKDLGLERPVG